MSYEKIMYKVENKQLSNFLISKLDDLISTSCLFFEYLLIPRDGYLNVFSETMNEASIPVIGGTLINYVISNVLGYKYKTFPHYNIYTSHIVDDYLISQKIDISKLKDKYSTMIENKLSIDIKLKIQQYYKDIKDKDEEPEYIRESIYTPIDNYLLWLTSIIIESPENLNNEELIIKNIDYFNNLEGDNVFYPKDYIFYEEDGNILTQSFIWLLCGMNDWLEKNIINYTDILFLSRILTPASDKVLADKNLRDVSKDDNYNNVKMNLKSAVFTNEFFISDKAIEKLTNLFINLMNEFRKNPSGEFVKRIKLLSIII